MIGIKAMIFLLPFMWAFGKAFPASEFRDTVSYQGEYSNRDYRFSVRIPAGLVGAGAAANAPNHGFVIHFSDDSDYINLVVDYNVTEPPSNRKSTNKPVPPRGFQVLQTRSQKRSLGGLEALQIWQRLRRNSDGAIYLAIGIGAKRKINDDEQIDYSINLQTPEQHYKERAKVFDSLVTSFHILSKQE